MSTSTTPTPTFDAERVLADYRAALEQAGLSAQTRRGYTSRVAGFLTWLAATPHSYAGDPLRDPRARDAAVKAYRAYLVEERQARPATVNAHLNALANFYRQRGPGEPAAAREPIPAAGPLTLTEDEQRRFLRAAQARGNARDVALALLLFYAGPSAEEVQDLDVDDVDLSPDRARIAIRTATGNVGREVPLHPAARTALDTWLDDRAGHRGAGESEALFLNRRGGRLLVRSIRTIVAEIAATAGLVHPTGPLAGSTRVQPHTLRRTMAEQLRRAGADPALVAGLLGQRGGDPGGEGARAAIHHALIVDG